MTITVSELRKGLKKYLEASEKETVFVTDHGKVIAEIESPSLRKIGTFKSLRGSIPDTMTLEEVKDERARSL